ncbi:insulinase family protein [Reinekea thalattae]|uniref:Peptidase M16 n=1 Tax=Reinekea thalattae TaxID=2593301 RepID=A0A5C8Z840_9GAMM|nr:insulinase family protein [Reinekea thalattae]TXR53474.1 peptidase M16 [Reinekea thalattae]
MTLNSACPAPFSSFSLIESRYIESLNIRLEHYRHLKTGAEHFHLASDSKENVFMVSLRTMPNDSTGVAHILEHTALCGSEKYPVRDPFFMMTRRSLNTFMNAMTSSDWTAYPFASENSKDYENLLSVYLDAVFFSRLDELDFQQEGHRLEFETDNDPSSPLQYKGIVFNEMKGAMSSPVSQLYQTVKSHLFPSNTYHYNSGGDPEHIPDLSYEQLKAFYKTHYHPSNASVFTFGDRPAADIQQRLEEQAFSRFEPLGHSLSVPPEKRFNSRLTVEASYPLETDIDNKTYHTLAWLLGESADLEQQLEAHLLSDLLLDNSASPLRKALETSEIGTNPSPLCGLDDSNREMIFLCGMEGSTPEQAEAFEQLVTETLQQVAEQGVSDDDIEAMLHQLELSQREITGDSYPYGLQLIFSVTGAATHGGSVMESLDIDQALAQLREKTKQPGYIGEAIERLLLNNAHRVQLSFKPNPEFKARQLQHERDRLDTIQQTLSDEQAQQIVATAQALKERQAQVDDDSLLPKVTLDDVNPEVKTIKAHKNGPVVQYAAGTNGLVYQQWYWPIPQLTVDEQQLMPLYTAMLPELGAGKFDYLEMQQQQAAKTGALNLYSLYKTDIQDTSKLNGYLVLSGKALEPNAQALTDIMEQHWLNARFDETDRIQDYLNLMSSRRVQGITGSGHSLAMQASSASHAVGSALSYHNTGLPAIARLKGWIQAWQQDPKQLGPWLQALQSLHRKFQASSAHALVVGEQDSLAELERIQLATQMNFAEQGASHHQSIALAAKENLVWSVDTQVNFCAAAYKTVAPEHPDSAALTILAGVLRNNYLHTAVREQGGAYGGGASHDNSNGVFRFYSYRDPRLEETLEDFSKSLNWLEKTSISDDQVEQSILGVVSSLDKPGSPAGEAKAAYQNLLFNRSDDFRKYYREQLLSVTSKQLVDVAGRYLTDDNKTEAVITDTSNAERLADKGFAWHKLSE